MLYRWTLSPQVSILALSTGSPPRIRTFKDGTLAGVRISVIVDGARVACVTSSFCMDFSRLFIRSLSDGMQIHPPWINVEMKSYILIDHMWLANWSTRLSSLMPKAFLCAIALVDTEAWSFNTPLGSPELPDVNTKNAVVSAVAGCLLGCASIVGVYMMQTSDKGIISLPKSSKVAAISACTIATLNFVALAMSFLRWIEKVGLSVTQIPPDLSTASIVMTAHFDFSKQSNTGLSASTLKDLKVSQSLSESSSS